MFRFNREEILRLFLAQELTLPTAKAGGIPNSTTIAPKIASYMVSKGVNSRVPHGI